MLINTKPVKKKIIRGYLAGNNGLLACSLLPIAVSAFDLHRVLLSYAHASRYLLTEAITTISLTTPLPSCAVWFVKKSRLLQF